MKKLIGQHGYVPQTESNIDLATELRYAEERHLRVLEKMSFINMERDVAGIGKSGQFDPHCLAEARTCIQTGAMWAVRAIFQPQRIILPEDIAPTEPQEGGPA